MAAAANFNVSDSIWAQQISNKFQNLWHDCWKSICPCIRSQRGSLSHIYRYTVYLTASYTVDGQNKSKVKPKLHQWAQLNLPRGLISGDSQDAGLHCSYLRWGHALTHEYTWGMEELAESLVWPPGISRFFSTSKASVYSFESFWCHVLYVLLWITPSSVKSQRMWTVLFSWHVYLIKKQLDVQ